MSKIEYLSPEDFETKFEDLKFLGLDFERVTTSQKIYLKVKNCRYYLSNSPNDEIPLSFASLALVKKTREEVEYNYNNYIGPFPNNIGADWFQTVRKPYTWNRSKDVVEFFGHPVQEPTKVDSAEVWAIDLSAAYLTTAKNMGLLSPQTYARFFEQETNKKKRARLKKIKFFRGHNGEVYKHSKLARLIALGSLATDKKIELWKGGEIVSQSREYNETNANIFYTIAAETGKKMAEIMEKHGGFFTYVDCVFVPAENGPAAVADFAALGYPTNLKKGFLSQDGCSFEFVHGETAEVKNYMIPAGKSYRLKYSFQDDWFKDYLGQIKEALQDPEIDKEELKDIVAEELKRELGLSADFANSKLDLIYIAEGLEKVGLQFRDLFKLTATVKEELNIWGDTIYWAAYTKILKVTDFESGGHNLPEMAEQATDPNTGLVGEMRRDIKIELKAFNEPDPEDFEEFEMPKGKQIFELTEEQRKQLESGLNDLCPF